MHAGSVVVAGDADEAGVVADECEVNLNGAYVVEAMVEVDAEVGVGEIDNLSAAVGVAYEVLVANAASPVVGDCSVVDADGVGWGEVSGFASSDLLGQAIDGADASGVIVAVADADATAPSIGVQCHVVAMDLGSGWAGADLTELYNNYCSPL